MVNWTTWGGTYTYSPVAIEHPQSHEELASVVKEAAASGRRVKVPGTGHSFTDIAGTDGVSVSLDGYNRLLEVDGKNLTATVQAGITIHSLSDALSEHGMALPSLGDIGYQTIAGAVSTGTHGTGIRFGGIAAQIKSAELVIGDGSTVTCSEEDLDLLNAARVGLGALGALSTITLQCVPAFTLHSVETPRDLNDCLGELDSLIEKNEHFEFYWFPHTEKVVTLEHNRTDRPPRPKSRSRAYFEDVLLENHVFGLVCRIGRLRPSMIPGLARTTASALSKSVTSDRSDRVFTNPRYVRFVEMEYAIPREAGAEALLRVKRMIEDEGLLISFPIEARFVGGEDIFLSTSHGRQTCYIAVHMFRGMEFETYFRKVEAIMNDYQGRPHWGKMHYQTADTLATRYPQWDRFLAIRNRLDPNRVFSNSYLERVLGG